MISRSSSVSFLPNLFNTDLTGLESGEPCTGQWAGHCHLLNGNLMVSSHPCHPPCSLETSGILESLQCLLLTVRREGAGRDEPPQGPPAVAQCRSTGYEFSGRLLLSHEAPTQDLPDGKAQWSCFSVPPFRFLV